MDGGIAIDGDMIGKIHRSAIEAPGNILCIIRICASRQHNTAIDLVAKGFCASRTGIPGILSCQYSTNQDWSTIWPLFVYILALGHPMCNTKERH